MKNNSFLTDADSFFEPRHIIPGEPIPTNWYMMKIIIYVYDDNEQGKGDDRNADFNIFEERANTSHENTTQSFKSVFDVELKINSMFKLTSQ